MGNILWTVSTDWANAMAITDNKPNVCLIKKEYTTEEYAMIRAEADEWNVEVSMRMVTIMGTEDPNTTIQFRTGKLPTIY